MKITDDMLTGWFPPEMKPVYKGVYPTEIRWGSLVKKGFSYWDGKYWSHGEDIPQEAERMRRNTAIGIQGKYWRGLKDEPSLAFEYAHKLVAQRLNKEPQRD